MCPCSHPATCAPQLRFTGRRKPIPSQKKRAGCPSNHRVVVHKFSVCINTCTGDAVQELTQNLIYLLVYVLWNLTRDSLHRTKGMAGMWNKQYSNFKSRQGQLFKEPFQEGHKFEMLRILSRILRKIPACLLIFHIKFLSPLLVIFGLLRIKCKIFLQFFNGSRKKCSWLLRQQLGYNLVFKLRHLCNIKSLHCTQCIRRLYKKDGQRSSHCTK